MFSSLATTNSYAKERFRTADLSTREEEISIKRLDKLLMELFPDFASRRIMLRMDTQGCDLNVFAGTEGIMTSVLALQSEVSCLSIFDGMPYWTQVIATFEHADFGIYGLFPVTWNSDRIVEYDCPMSKRLSSDHARSRVS